MNRVWNNDEREYVRANAATMTDQKIAETLTRATGRQISLQAVRKQRQKLRIKKAHGRGVCKLVGDPTTPFAGRIKLKLQGEGQGDATTR